jgi:RHS repeat-associated protein
MPKHRAGNPPAGQVWRKYYLAGGQRLAMRVRQSGQNDKLYYLLTDHLGSTSVSYEPANGQVTQQKYMPWGELRGTENVLPTDYTFTGQKWEQEIGLMDFKARLYDPKLGRFISADSVVPGGVQELDRYSYVFNNPLRNTDPSGHNPECGPDGVYCDNDEWNDYDFDPIGLTESGEKLISLAKELEELTGHRITLKMMIRLIFEREYDGFINNAEVEGAYAEAAGRGYWDWAQNKYGIHQYLRQLA